MSESQLEKDETTRREIPATRYVAIGWLVLVLVFAGVFAWELQMRSLGLRAGDLDDSKSHWTVERRKLASGEHDDIVIIGSSRILFDTDLDAWEDLTGRRPIQLALPGTNPRPFLKDFAENTDFSGLIVVGVTPDLFFTDWEGIPLFAGVREFWKTESPSQRFGHRVGLFLSRRLAFLDDSYKLMTLIDRVYLPDRPGVRGPVMDVWKVWETSDGRQTHLWSRLVTDKKLRDHARLVWGPFNGEPVEADVITRACSDASASVAKIRARGGEVVFIRAPSAGLYYESEQHAAPRARTWDRLLRETGAYGVHFEDLEGLEELEVPEWSHLSQDSATKFTRAYIGQLVKDLPWLRSRLRTEVGS
jgi:hypothetical protein